MELKINGHLIGYLYGYNSDLSKRLLSQEKKKAGSVYYFEYYRPNGKELIREMIKHKREDGIEELIAKAMKKIKKIDKRREGNK